MSAAASRIGWPGKTGTGGSLWDGFQHTRARTLSLAAPLSAEDQAAQSMPDASPTKWHLAHTSWFFETFVLASAGRPPFHPAFGYLFNSYYEALGERQPRPQRGLLTRPSREEVLAYRRHVDQEIGRQFARGLAPEAEALIRLGIAHEEQHQELILTDVLHLLAQSPLEPAYMPADEGNPTVSADPGEMGFVAFEGGVTEIGCSGGGFHFDNEGPRHKVFLQPYRLADRLVTNREWLGFMEDGGYARPELWLSDGWSCVQAEGWRSPLYWRAEGEEWREFTLRGLLPVDPHAPVSHVSFYEADAFARWKGLRLPTEAEWENAAAAYPVEGNFVDSGRLRPQPAQAGSGLRQLYGDVWEWTASAYSPYPGFRPSAGAVGEYNGKFMINQMVLRGGSCVTPERHVSASYRNFFHPHQRWQFTGVRLAGDGW